MFGWISDRFSTTGETQGALASARSARALIARLETESPQYAMDELAKQFHAAPREALCTPNGLRALQLLDEWAQPALTKLWDSLLADTHGQTVRAAAWGTLTRYYRRSFLAYWNSVGPSAGTEAPKAQTTESLSAVRSMAALHRYILLQRTNYLAIAEDSWTHVWRLMSWAEQQQMAATAPYPHCAATTIEREFLISLLIEVAPTGNLLPGQILALDHLLHEHADHYRKADRYDAQSTPFSYQPARSEAPQRHLQGLKIHDGMRFFGPGSANAQICAARDAAHALRNPPQWLAQAGCSVEAYVELLDRLAAHWAPDPPRRRHPRESCSGEILVAHDLPTIRRLVKFSELALSGQSLSYDAENIYKVKDTVRTNGDAVNSAFSRVVTPKEALANLVTFEKSLPSDATEAWQLNDSSESGVGASAQPDCPWVKVGMVVAFRLRDSVDWQVALVRRLSRNPQSPLCIGLARLGDKARSARLRRGIGAVDYAKCTGEIEYDAIILKAATSSLLLPVGVFDQTQKYTLTCENRQQVVKMEKSLERRPNFECVQISEVEMLRAA